MRFNLLLLMKYPMITRLASYPSATSSIAVMASSKEAAIGYTAMREVSSFRDGTVVGVRLRVKPSSPEKNFNA